MVIFNDKWEGLVLQQIAGSKSRIRIVTPQLSTLQVEDYLRLKRKDVFLELTTNFGMKNFFSGDTQLDAVEALVKAQTKTYGIPGLGAAFAIFDEQIAVVSSGNIISEGPISARSYNLLLDNPYIAQQLSTDFDSLCQLENAHPYSLESIQNLRHILDRLTSTEKQASSAPLSQPSSLLDTLSLKGWSMDVMDVLLKINTNRFSLKDVYAYSTELGEIHPFNHHVEAKIRQQLQVLRDLGLLQFLGRGEYRKLW